jgi:hypothetical protein
MRRLDRRVNFPLVRKFKFPVTIPAFGPGQIRDEKLALSARSTLRACSNCEKQHAGDG